MFFDAFAEKLKRRLLLPLPGVASHEAVMPPNRRNLDTTPPPHARISAVLAILYLKDGLLHVPYIKRPTYPGVHSGQMAFPGGRSEPQDPDTMTTSLRETFEEIGVLVTSEQVIGQLTSLYIPPSNSLVYPFVAFFPERPIFSIDPAEVEQLVEVPLEALQHPDSCKETVIAVGPSVSIKTPAYQVEGQVIWGATAMMTSELLAIISEIEKD